MERNPDPLDVANDLAQIERDAAAQVRKAVPRATGRCLWCATPCVRQYCDHECEADHLQSQWAQAQTPRRR